MQPPADQSQSDASEIGEQILRCLAQVTEPADLAIILADERRRCHHLNAAARARSGIPEDRASGMLVMEVLGRLGEDSAPHPRGDTRADVTRDPEMPLAEEQVGRAVTLSRASLGLTVTPLRQGGTTIGALVQTCAPDPGDGAGSERHRLLRELESERARLRQILLTAPVLISVTRGPDHVFELVNPSYRRMLHGREVVGRRLRDALPELDGQGFFELRDELYASGRTHMEDELRVVADLDGDGHPEECFLNVVTQPLRDGHGQVEGMLTLAVDVTSQVQARRTTEEQAVELERRERTLQVQAVRMEAAQRELERLNAELTTRADQAEAATARAREAGARLEILAQAGAVLGSSLDVADTLHALAELVVPDVADWCFVEMQSADGPIETVAVHHSDPIAVAHAREGLRRFPIDPAAPHGTARVLRTGELELVADISPELLASIAQDDEHLALLLGIGFRSYVSVPLEVRGRTLGVLSLVMAESGRRFSEADLPFVGELARRAALAVDNSRLYTAEREARLQAERSAERSRLLQAVAAALNEAATAEQVAAACVEHGRLALGADSGSLALLVDGGAAFEVVYSSYPPHVADAWRRFPFDPRKPLSAAVDSLRPVLIESRSDGESRFPTIARALELSDTAAFAATPLIAGGSAVGGLSFSFVAEQVLGEAETTFLATLGEQAAQALERARLLDAERAARAEAESANRAKSEFLSAMSHELRTPLNAIAGYVDLLEAGVRGPLTEAQLSDLGRIKRAESVLLNLINDILNFARIEAGRIEIRREPIPLGQIVAGLDGILAPQMHSRGLRYDCEPVPEDALVLGDAERIRQILTNLLANAAKFTPAGGRITVSAVVEPARVRIRVADTGRGVPVDKLEAIFEPFVQLDRQSGPDSQKGVGLGLAISRELAHAMDGDLAAESEPGVGSVFTLTLPAPVPDP